MSDLTAPARIKVDLTGHTYGAWTVLRWSSRDRHGKQMWLCRCACGSENEVEAYNLTAERSLACRPCSAAAASAFRRTHGQSCTKTYIEWQAMKTRCYNKNHKSWKYHGAKGITVAFEWLKDYAAFAAYVGEPPSHLHVVGRISQDRGYEPGNVRWMTHVEAYRRPKVMQDRGGNERPSHEDRDHASPPGVA